MIKKLFKEMLLTQILSAMTVTVCMLIDSIMIGRFLGMDAMTAYGLSAPVLLVFAALGSMAAAGVQVLCGKTMGAGDKKGTDACYTAAVMLVIIISGIGLIVSFVFTDPICVALGAAKNGKDSPVFKLTADYLRGFIIGAPAFLAAQILVPFMQMSGKRVLMIAAVLTMTVGDIVFDILTVFVFDGGTFGMGMASSLSYYLAIIIGLVYFLSKDCIFKFRAKLLKAEVFKNLLRNGVPTLINQISLVLLTYVLNRILLRVEGNLGVAAYSVINTAGNVCYSFSSGVASVALMLSAIFYADEDKTALKDLVRIMCINGLMLCLIVTATVLVAASPLVSLFIDDPAKGVETKGLATGGMRLFILSLMPCAMNTCFKNYYQGIGRIHLSETISIFQNFVLTAVAAVVLSGFLGTTGVWLAFVCGETTTLLFIALHVFHYNKKAKFSAEAFSMLPKDFGVKDEDCLEMTLLAADEVVPASEKATQFCNDHGMDKKTGTLIGLCIEELSNNIIEHGFSHDRRQHSIDIRIALTKEGAVLRFRDNCFNFDPVQYMEMHLEGEEDNVSHIGLRMVMKLTKSANYINSLGLNNLTLCL